MTRVKRKESTAFLQEHVRSILDALPGAVLVRDGSGEVVYANRSARSLLNGRTVQNGGRADASRRVSAGPTTGSQVPIHDGTGTIVGSLETIEERDTHRLVAHQLEDVACLVGDSHAMTELRSMVLSVASSEGALLITGESGTGKTAIAQRIHDVGSRAGFPFEVVNCETFSGRMLFGELFGRSKGTAAGRSGRVALAASGTLVLEEIGRLSKSVQAELRQVVSRGEYRRTPSSDTLRADVRVIGTTRGDIENAVERGTFDRELFYLLNTAPIHVPPLRTRVVDIPALAEHLLSVFNGRTRSRKIDGVAPEVLDLFCGYDFPGNVREIEEVLQRAFLQCHGRTIRLEHLPRPLLVAAGRTRVANGTEGSVEALEREFLLRALEDNEWRLQVVAEQLQVSRTTLWRKLRRLGIDNPRRS